MYKLIKSLGRNTMRMEKKILVVEILQKQFSKWEKYAAMDGHTGEKNNLGLIKELNLHNVFVLMKRNVS